MKIPHNKILTAGHYGNPKIKLEEDLLYSPESPSVEKLFERIAYEPTNGVSRSNRISTTVCITNPSGQLFRPKTGLERFLNKWGEDYLK